MARSTPLAPMIGPDAVSSARCADPVAEDGRVGGGDAAPDGRRRPAQRWRLPAQRGGADGPLRREQADTARGGAGAGVRAACRGPPRLAHRRTGARARPRDRRPSRRPSARVVRRDDLRRDDRPLRRRADGGAAAHRSRLRGGVRRARPHAGRGHPCGLAVGSACGDDGRVSPQAGRAVRQRDARHDRGHAARNPGAAHGIRLQGATAGIEGRLREGDAVLPPPDGVHAVGRRRRGGSALAQAPRHDAQPAC